MAPGPRTRSSIFTLGLLLTAAPAARADQLVVSFEGIIPSLTVTTEAVVSGQSGTISDVRNSQTFLNIPFSGQFILDSGRIALATPDSSFAPFLLRSFTDTDPTNVDLSNTGVETEEWLKGSLSLQGGVGKTLAFDRQLIAQTPPGGSTFFAFSGKEQVQYMDGRDNSSQPGLAETGDAFGLTLSNSYAWVVLNGPYAAGQQVGAEDISFLSLLILSSATNNPPGIVHFFGPGAPSSFLWVDPVPGTCSGADCNDGYYSVSSPFSKFTEQTIAVDPAAGTFEFDSESISGGMIFSRVALTTVPEPASLTLLLLIVGFYAAHQVRARLNRPSRKSLLEG